MSEVYDVDSDFPGFRDAHRGNLRPSVVVRLVPSLGMLNLLTRTTDLAVEGVEHPPTPEWGLMLPGKFGRSPVQTLELGWFKHPLVDYLGDLDADTWSAVLTMWEGS